jgi:hypothetical protein
LLPAATPQPILKNYTLLLGTDTKRGGTIPIFIVPGGQQNQYLGRYLAHIEQGPTETEFGACVSKATAGRKGHPVQVTTV